MVDVAIEKHNMYDYKSSIFLEYIHIDNALLSNKISSGEKNYKYFVGYFYDGYKIRPLHIMLPKTSACIKNYNFQTKRIFLIEVDELLEKYNTIWDKVSTDVKK